MEPTTIFLLLFIASLFAMILAGGLLKAIGSLVFGIILAFILFFMGACAIPGTKGDDEWKYKTQLAIIYGFWIAALIVAVWFSGYMGIWGIIKYIIW